MTILFSGCEPSSFDIVTGVYSQGTNNIFFDTTTNHVTSMLCLAATNEYSATLSASDDEIWFHARAYFTVIGSGTYLNFADSASLGFRLRGATTGYQLEKSVNGGTGWTTVGPIFSLLTGSDVDLDIHIKAAATGGVAEVFQNGARQMSFSGDTSTATDLFNNLHFTSPNGGTWHFSEVFVANVPTLDWKAVRLAPNASGTYSEWTGAFGDVSESTLNDSTFITTNTVNNREAFNSTDLTTTILNNSEIKALVIGSRVAITADATPADVRHLLRSGGTDYTSADLGVAKDSVKRARVSVFETDPATSANWTLTNLNAAQTGMKAV